MAVGCGQVMTTMATFEMVVAVDISLDRDEGQDERGA